MLRVIAGEADVLGDEGMDVDCEATLHGDGAEFRRREHSFPRLEFDLR